MCSTIFSHSGCFFSSPSSLHPDSFVQKVCGYFRRNTHRLFIKILSGQEIESMLNGCVLCYFFFVFLLLSRLSLARQQIRSLATHIIFINITPYTNDETLHFLHSFIYHRQFFPCLLVHISCSLERVYTHMPIIFQKTLRITFFTYIKICGNSRKVLILHMYIWLLAYCSFIVDEGDLDVVWCDRYRAKTHMPPSNIIKPFIIHFISTFKWTNVSRKWIIISLFHILYMYNILNMTYTWMHTLISLHHTILHKCERQSCRW